MYLLLRSKDPELVKVLGRRKMPTAEQDILYLGLAHTEICIDTVSRNGLFRNVADWVKPRGVMKSVVLNLRV